MRLLDIQLQEVNDSAKYFPGVSDVGNESLLYMITALAGEVGEVANVIKKYYRDGWSRADLEARLRGELPDILIYLVMLSDMLGINLEDAYKAKKEYNDRRFSR